MKKIIGIIFVVFAFVHALNAEDTIIIKLSSDAGLYVTLKGQKFTIPFSKSTSVGEIKKAVYEKFHVPIDQQSLYWEARMLGDDKQTLSSYGIEKETVVSRDQTKKPTMVEVFIKNKFK